MNTWQKLRSGDYRIDYRTMLEIVRREKISLAQEIKWLEEREQVLLEWIAADDRQSGIGSPGEGK